MKFISDWSLKRDLNLYRTEVERDWAFIVKREYRYIVLGRSVGDGIFAGSLLWSAAIF